MLKLNYFLADIFILSAEKQPIKLSWRKIEWLLSDQLHGLEPAVIPYNLLHQFVLVNGKNLSHDCYYINND